MKKNEIYVILTQVWGMYEQDSVEIYNNQFYTDKQAAIAQAYLLASNEIKDTDTWVHDLHEMAQNGSQDADEIWDECLGNYEWRDMCDGRGMSINVIELSSFVGNSK